MCDDELYNIICYTQKSTGDEWKKKYYYII